jgi:hypothetical protein
MMEEKALVFLSEAVIRRRAEAITTTNPFDVGTPVERAMTAVAEAPIAVGVGATTRQP